MFSEKELPPLADQFKQRLDKDVVFAGTKNPDIARIIFPQSLYAWVMLRTRDGQPHARPVERVFLAYKKGEHS